MDKLLDQFNRYLIPPIQEQLHEKLVSQIKNLIFSDGVEVGQKLPSERDLADQFEVSRVVVREALKSLKQSGLIEIRTGANGGAFVVDNHHMPFYNSVYDLLERGKLALPHFHEAREAIECRSVRLAAQKATKEDIKRLRALNRKIVDDPRDRKYLNRNSIAFHVAIAEISGNPLIRLLVQSLMELLVSLYPILKEPNKFEINPDQQMKVTGKFAKETYKVHEEIIRAIESGDQVRCEQLMVIDAQRAKNIKPK